MSKRSARARHNRERKVQGALDCIAAERDGGHVYGKGAERRYVARLKPRNESQEEYMASIDVADVIFGIGPAGTGKTYIAVCVALEMLASGRISRLVLARPAVEAEGEKLGFLPGDLHAKLEPYLLPIYDVLSERVGWANLRKMIADGRIEICPLAFMRGRTFNDAAIILDEMQNATAKQLKMALTRAGERTKVIVTGDPEQSDLEEKGQSGLEPVADALEGAPGIEVLRFRKADVVRSQTVRTVLERI